MDDDQDFETHNGVGLHDGFDNRVNIPSSTSDRGFFKLNGRQENNSKPRRSRKRKNGNNVENKELGIVNQIPQTVSNTGNTSSVNSSSSNTAMVNRQVSNASSVNNSSYNTSNMNTSNVNNSSYNTSNMNTSNVNSSYSSPNNQYPGMSTDNVNTQVSMYSVANPVNKYGDYEQSLIAQSVVQSPSQYVPDVQYDQYNMHDQYSQYGGTNTINMNYLNETQPVLLDNKNDNKTVKIIYGVFTSLIIISVLLLAGAIYYKKRQAKKSPNASEGGYIAGGDVYRPRDRRGRFMKVNNLI